MWDIWTFLVVPSNEPYVLLTGLAKTWRIGDIARIAFQSSHTKSARLRVHWQQPTSGPSILDLNDALKVHLTREALFQVNIGSLYLPKMTINRAVNENHTFWYIVEGEEEVCVRLIVFSFYSANCNIVTKLVEKLVLADLLPFNEAKQLHGDAKRCPYAPRLSFWSRDWKLLRVAPRL